MLVENAPFHQEKVVGHNSIKDKPLNLSGWNISTSHLSLYARIMPVLLKICEYGKKP